MMFVGSREVSQVLCHPISRRDENRAHLASMLVSTRLRPATDDHLPVPPFAISFRAHP